MGIKRKRGLHYTLRKTQLLETKLNLLEQDPIKNHYLKKILKIR